jgi:hypothetical protein
MVKITGRGFGRPEEPERRKTNSPRTRQGASVRRPQTTDPQGRPIKPDSEPIQMLKALSPGERLIIDVKLATDATDYLRIVGNFVGYRQVDAGKTEITFDPVPPQQWPQAWNDTKAHPLARASARQCLEVGSSSSCPVFRLASLRSAPELLALHQTIATRLKPFQSQVLAALNNREGQVWGLLQELTALWPGLYPNLDASGRSEQFFLHLKRLDTRFAEPAGGPPAPSHRVAAESAMAGTLLLVAHALQLLENQEIAEALLLTQSQYRAARAVLPRGHWQDALQKELKPKYLHSLLAPLAKHLRELVDRAGGNGRLFWDPQGPTGLEPTSNQTAPPGTEANDPAFRVWANQQPFGGLGANLARAALRLRSMMSPEVERLMPHPLALPSPSLIAADYFHSLRRVVSAADAFTPTDEERKALMVGGGIHAPLARIAQTAARDFNQLLAQTLKDGDSFRSSDPLIRAIAWALPLRLHYELKNLDLDHQEAPKDFPSATETYWRSLGAFCALSGSEQLPNQLYARTFRLWFDAHVEALRERSPELDEWGARASLLAGSESTRLPLAPLRTLAEGGVLSTGEISALIPWLGRENLIHGESIDPLEPVEGVDASGNLDEPPIQRIRVHPPHPALEGILKGVWSATRRMLQAPEQRARLEKVGDTGAEQVVPWVRFDTRRPSATYEEQLRTLDTLFRLWPENSVLGMGEALTSQFDTNTLGNLANRQPEILRAIIAHHILSARGDGQGAQEERGMAYPPTARVLGMDAVSALETLVASDLPAKLLGDQFLPRWLSTLQEAVVYPLPTELALLVEGALPQAILTVVQSLNRQRASQFPRILDALRNHRGLGHQQIAILKNLMGKDVLPRIRQHLGLSFRDAAALRVALEDLGLSKATEPSVLVRVAGQLDDLRQSIAAGLEDGSPGSGVMAQLPHVSTEHLQTFLTDQDQDPFGRAWVPALQWVLARARLDAGTRSALRSLVPTTDEGRDVRARRQNILQNFRQRVLGLAQEAPLGLDHVALLHALLKKAIGLDGVSVNELSLALIDGAILTKDAFAVLDTVDIDALQAERENLFEAVRQDSTAFADIARAFALERYGTFADLAPSEGGGSEAFGHRVTSWLSAVEERKDLGALVFPSKVRLRIDPEDLPTLRAALEAYMGQPLDEDELAAHFGAVLRPPVDHPSTGGPWPNGAWVWATLLSHDARLAEASRLADGAIPKLTGEMIREALSSPSSSSQRMLTRAILSAVLQGCEKFPPLPGSKHADSSPMLQGPAMNSALLSAGRETQTALINFLYRLFPLHPPSSPWSEEELFRGASAVAKVGGEVDRFLLQDVLSDVLRAADQRGTVLEAIERANAMETTSLLSPGIDPFSFVGPYLQVQVAKTLFPDATEAQRRRLMGGAINEARAGEALGLAVGQVLALQAQDATPMPGVTLDRKNVETFLSAMLRGNIPSATGLAEKEIQALLRYVTELIRHPNTPPLPEALTDRSTGGARSAPPALRLAPVPNSNLDPRVEVFASWMAGVLEGETFELPSWLRGLQVEVAFTNYGIREWVQVRRDGKGTICGIAVAANAPKETTDILESLLSFAPTNEVSALPLTLPAVNADLRRRWFDGLSEPEKQEARLLRPTLGDLWSFYEEVKDLWYAQQAIMTEVHPDWDFGAFTFRSFTGSFGLTHLPSPTDNPEENGKPLSTRTGGALSAFAQAIFGNAWVPPSVVEALRDPTTQFDVTTTGPLDALYIFAAIAFGDFNTSTDREHWAWRDAHDRMQFPYATSTLEGFGQNNPAQSRRGDMKKELGGHFKALPPTDQRLPSWRAAQDPLARAWCSVSPQSLTVGELESLLAAMETAASAPGRSAPRDLGSVRAFFQRLDFGWGVDRAMALMTLFLVNQRHRLLTTLESLPESFQVAGQAEARLDRTTGNGIRLEHPDPRRRAGSITDVRARGTGTRQSFRRDRDPRPNPSL